MDWLSHLNPEQQEAVLHTSGPLLILAGAGSGKTTVLVSRAGRLISDGSVRPNQLCVLTFTNKAARELKHRLTARLGTSAKGVWAGTFHSFGLQLLRQHHQALALPKHFGVIDPSDAGSLLKELLLSYHNPEKVAFDADLLLQTLAKFREEERKLQKTDDIYEQAIEWLIPRYEKKLQQLAVVDFDDLLLKPLLLLQEGDSRARELQEKYQQMMVDEFQDTNVLQMRLVRMLTQTHTNLTVVGDDDQSIYGWRGACIRNILDFPKLYRNCKVIRLERNYRSTPAILNLANQVIGKNTERHGKTLFSEKSESGPLPEVIVYPSETEEAEGIATDITLQLSRGVAPKDIAVLFRSNTQGALIEAELRRTGHPYAISGGTAFFDRREIRDVLAYLKCAVRPQDLPFRRILNTPARGIGEKSIQAIQDLSDAQNISFYQAACQADSLGLDPNSSKSIQLLIGTLRTLSSKITNPSLTSPQERLLQFLREIGYPNHLNKTSAQTSVGQQKWRNVELFADILGRTLSQQPSIEGLKNFLERLELRDAPEEEDKNQIQVMTLHACKGLEFPIVYFLGVEEDIIPHRRLGLDISEERRLFYVGVTRAKEQLILTRCRKRKRHGKLQNCVPSRFLSDVPDSMYVEHLGERPTKTSHRKALLSDLYKKLDSMGV